MLSKGYDVYLGEMLLPVTPSKITLTISNRNETITLMNEGEVNLLKSAGLTSVSFSCLIPSADYAFSKETGKSPEYYLNNLEKIKQGKKPIQFIVVRMRPDFSKIFTTNLTVSLEDYEVSESAEQGFDFVLTVKLKQFKPYGTKTVKLKKQVPSGSNSNSMAEGSRWVNRTGRVNKSRDQSSSPRPQGTASYKTGPGDSLWSISKKMYGGGDLYPRIAKANPDKIDNPNIIAPRLNLTIPK